MLSEAKPGKPYRRGRISTIDLRVLASLDHLSLIQKLFFFFYKATYPNEKVNRTEPSPSVRVPCQEHHIGRKKVLCDLSLEEVQTEMVLMGAGDNFRCLAAASSSEERYSEKHASLLL